MLHNEVRQYAADKDIRSLKFWFKGSLDGDPTFRKYEEDYAYCKANVPQLFEAHQELTPFSFTHVDEHYWTQIKNDLMENFSEQRFDHMKQAAQIFYKERIEAIRAEEERAAAKQAEEQAKARAQAEAAAQAMAQHQAEEDAILKQQQADAERIAKLKAEYAAKESAKQAQEAAERERLSREAREAAQKASQPQTPQGDSDSKKAPGLNPIALTAVIVIIILIILIVSSRK